jgi:hypothetical protein
MSFSYPSDSCFLSLFLGAPFFPATSNSEISYNVFLLYFYFLCSYFEKFLFWSWFIFTRHYKYVMEFSCILYFRLVYMILSITLKQTQVQYCHIWCFQLHLLKYKVRYCFENNSYYFHNVTNYLRHTTW